MNRTEQEIRGTITGVERLANSVNGNPRWRVALQCGAVEDTEPDATVAFDVPTATARVCR